MYRRAYDCEGAMVVRATSPTPHRSYVGRGGSKNHDGSSVPPVRVGSVLNGRSSVLPNVA